MGKSKKELKAEVRLLKKQLDEMKTFGYVRTDPKGQFKKQMPDKKRESSDYY